MQLVRRGIEENQWVSSRIPQRNWVIKLREKVIKLQKVIKLPGEAGPGPPSARVRSMGDERSESQQEEGKNETGAKSAVGACSAGRKGLLSD